MKHLLVPCDFKEESKTAIAMAGKLASKVGASITLLHILYNEEGSAEAEEKIGELKAELASLVNCPINTLVKAGDILEAIGETAHEVQADLAVMITHGLQGSQQITGSLALNVITQAELPFLVVQSKTGIGGEIQKVLVALEYRQQSEEELSKIIAFTKVLDAQVELFFHQRPAEAKHSELQSIVSQQFEEAGIAFTLEENQKFDFSKAVVERSKAIGAQLIIALNYSYENLYSINPRTDEEDLIYNNAAIPILLITPQNQDEDLEKPEDLL
ncbi:MAG: universal stress protein [Flavobacteriales bacterium]|jgi:nucleotide-binding universal stress UspA family protein